MEVGGALRARKITAEESVEVGGSITTEEGVTARLVEIGRNGDVHGPLKADQVIIGKGASAETVYGKNVLLRSGAQAERVYGENITIEHNCRISGEIQYTSELSIAESVWIAKPPQKVDKLPF